MGQLETILRAGSSCLSGAPHVSLQPIEQNVAWQNSVPGRFFLWVKLVQQPSGRVLLAGEKLGHLVTILSKLGL